MRTQLQKIKKQRIRFRATVERFGSKKGWKDSYAPTILFKDVRRVDTGEQVTDHLWFTLGKTISALSLAPGDVVEFDARVDSYAKGYVDRREGTSDRTIDYKLNRPTRLMRVGRNATIGNVSQEDMLPIQKKTSRFSAGELVQCIAPEHSHCGKEGEVIKALNNLWVEVDFGDYQGVFSDKRLKGVER